ncbi:MAG: adenine deaminase [Proteobacteria bacterium]|nr:adenine deaminase [Pseudomonadota bacterium]
MPKGTTTAICDPHELANVQGIRGIEYFLKAAEETHQTLQIMLSSCVPATNMETNWGGGLSASQLLTLKNHPQALGLAEMMNVPGVLFKNNDVLDKIVAFEGKPLDGHCPLLRGRELSAYASVGISSCHESSELEEAKEKLSKGIVLWIREGSVAKDLTELIPLLNWNSSPFIGFCTDDRNPLDISKEGHIDYLIRTAIQQGIAPEIAYRSASWSVANHYGLNKGPKRVGALAPGYAADVVLLNDLRTCAIGQVIKSGCLVSELSFPSESERHVFGNSIKAKLPEHQDLEGPIGPIHCIDIQAGKIITGRSVRSSEDPTVAKLSVLERYGKGSKPANGYVSGFGENLRGAIASSVGHDSHNLCVVGKKTEDMRVALAALIDCGGGFAVVQNQKVIAYLPLPFGGLMSLEDPNKVAKDLILLRQASQAIGCALPEPFLQLAFLCLPVIPQLKLTDKGLVDVEQFKIIDVRAV